MPSSTRTTPPSVAVSTERPMLDLAAWHAEPIPRAEAEAQLTRLRTAARWEARLEALRLRELLGLPADMQREVLLAEMDDERKQAAVELITGQVMLARRLQGAWDWLQAAEQRLAHHLSGPDYLVLLRRHAALRPLILFPTPRPLRPLSELLAIAQATARLKGPNRALHGFDQRDTLG